VHANTLFIHGYETALFIEESDGKELQRGGNISSPYKQKPLQVDSSQSLNYLKNIFKNKVFLATNSSAKLMFYTGLSSYHVHPS
jgi:hypothetical protein